MYIYEHHRITIEIHAISILWKHNSSILREIKTKKNVVDILKSTSTLAICFSRFPTSSNIILRWFDITHQHQQLSFPHFVSCLHKKKQSQVMVGPREPNSYNFAINKLANFKIKKFQMLYYFHSVLLFANV